MTSGIYPRPSALERFNAKVMPEPNSGCWIWMGALNRGEGGYGHISDRGRDVGAHRLAWTLFRGPIPDGLHIDHKCRNTACVNPDHLRPITRSANLATRELRQRRCRRGHLLSDDNLMFENGGRTRRCKTCRDLWRTERSTK